MSVLNSLLDAGGGDEKHELAGLVHMVGLLIAEYETRHFSSAHATPIDMLRFLMEQHELRQSDLPEIGSQGVVSEILNGKRELNLRQARALAKRFQLPVSALLEPKPGGATV
ncbi:transcriptional regulator [Massilia sp. SR12]